MADSKKLSFSPSPKAEQFPPKFHGLVLGLVGLIDAKGINMTQPLWPLGYLYHSFVQLCAVHQHMDQMISFLDNEN